MKVNSIITAIMLLAVVSCSREADIQEHLALAPVVRLGGEVLPDAVLVKLTAPLSETEQQAFEASNGIGLTKVFNSVPGKEELERQFGLDRWYEATVPASSGLEETARKLSRNRKVELVEYECIPTKASDGIVYAAGGVDTRAGSSAPFNDPYLTKQWHYQNYGNASVSKTCVAGADVNVYDVWSTLCCGDPDIVVAVIDEAVKYSHPDLAANMWTNKGEIPGNGIDDDGNGYIDDVYGYNFVDKSANLSWTAPDDSGHGSHCAGTIAAVNNNGKGVCGIAGGSGKGDGCRIMSCQIFSGKKGAGARGTGNAIKYAADNGASVISCSYGYGSSFGTDNGFIRAQGTFELDAIHYFEASRNNPVLNGNIAIFASGNDNKNYASYPGAFYDIISVSAFGPDFLPTYYTNYGPGCNIAAPGGEAYHGINKWESLVLSTIPTEVPGISVDGAFQVTGNDYGYMQGTSMACPHVSGVVALALSYAKKLGKTFDREEFKRMILASTKDIDQRIAGKLEKTYAYGQSPLKLAPYYHQMGAGAIDAWSLMMHVEGIPTLTVQTGREQWVDLTSIFGTSSVSLTYLNVEVPDAAVSSMGLQTLAPESTDDYPAVADANGYAYVRFGRLYVHPTKLGSGKITISAVGGGDHIGGGDNPTGGMVVTQTVSLLSREVDGGNGTGGWL